MIIAHGEKAQCNRRSLVFAHSNTTGKAQVVVIAWSWWGRGSFYHLLLAALTLRGRTSKKQSSASSSQRLPS